MLIGLDASRAARAQRTGTERYALEVIRHLLALPEAATHQWRLYLDNPPTGELLALAEPYNQVGVQNGNTTTVEFCLLPGRRLWTHRALGQAVRRRPPDVLFVPAHVLPFCWPAHLPPSVVTIHDLGYHYFPQAHTLRQRLYLPLSTYWSAWAATQVIAISANTAHDLQRLYAIPAAKVQVIHEAWTPPAALTPAPGGWPEQLPQHYCLYVGSLQPRKNLVRLLHAYGKLRRLQPAAPDLVIAGAAGWGSEDLPRLAATLGVAAQVHFLGYVAEATLPALYQNACFFCFPSLFEGFGLPVLEAQFYGVPVMTANHSSLPEVAGKGALLVDPTDVDAIATAMLRLSQDEALRQALIAAGHENVKRFSWTKAARETLAVLERVAQARKVKNR